MYCGLLGTICLGVQFCGPTKTTWKTWLPRLHSLLHFLGHPQSIYIYFSRCQDLAHIQGICFAAEPCPSVPTENPHSHPYPCHHQPRSLVPGFFLFMTFYHQAERFVWDNLLLTVFSNPLSCKFPEGRIVALMPNSWIMILTSIEWALEKYWLYESINTLIMKSYTWQ